ncbi:hypothetical protein TVAG_481060 [Trichomonas vaginalis G3]|uniref:Uncharacterized protein n=1 Tax=Trichomonas vaginalis (strain ATCC PRA-98 / G3) TaxID=412133 RepID=A2F8Q2_TRIV3|nr:hypothetical protein TVAGG3_0456310 [Trichomonas vaginalis G3]EAX98730.1 hypothetical protein TVAG_481060 [Trichomonas vaginalis G3]KAI5538488.1 hypothetical protein TVAGG3_0456310 [Trichomonas vaginalis G3]|eukprot:XP_001311660.1 hypothetical protein [Trichomonas vaginalis G3]
MEELFSLAISKTEVGETDIIEILSSIRDLIFSENEIPTNIQFSIEANTTNLWNKAVNLSRKLQNLPEEKQNILKNQAIPNIRSLCVDLFIKISPNDYDKIFRSGISVMISMFEACRYEEVSKYFEICKKVEPYINFELSHNIQCLVQMYITNSKSLIASCDPDSALQSLRDMTMRYPLASSSFSSYILQTANSLKSVEWTSFCIDFFRQNKELCDAFMSDAAILHFSILSSANRVSEIAEFDVDNIDIENDSKEFISIAKSIFTGNFDIDSVSSYKNERFLSRLAEIICLFIDKFDERVVDLLDRASRSDPSTRKQIIKVATKVNSLDLIRRVQFSEDDYPVIWNHCISLKTGRSFVDAVKWAGEMIADIKKCCNPNNECLLLKAMRFQSRCFLEMGEVSQAVDISRQCVSIMGSDENRVALIKALIRSGQLDEARNAGNEISKSDSITIVSTLFARESMFEDSAKLAIKAMSDSLDEKLFNVLVYCLQKQNSKSLVEIALNSLKKYQKSDFQKIESDLRREVVVLVNNLHVTSSLSLLVAIRIANHDEEEDILIPHLLRQIVSEGKQSEYLDILEEEIPRTKKIISTLKKFFLQIECDVNLQLLSKSDVSFLIKLLVRYPCKLTPYDIKALASLGNLDANDLCQIAVISFHQRLTPGELREILESLLPSAEIDESTSEFICCSMWNFGREMIGISDESDWFLATAVGISQRHQSLYLVRDQIASVYEEFVSRK